MQLARAFENEPDWDKAAKAYEAALVHYPNNAEALGNFARMRKEQYNATPDADPSLLEEGLVHCDRAIAIEPNNTGLWNTRGVLLKKLNRLPEAVGAYEKALQLNPDHSATCENLGVVQVLAGDLATGEKNIRRAAEFAGTTGSDCEFPWRNLASIELFHKSAKAAESLEKAITCNRVDSATWRLKARMYLELEGMSDAGRALEDARYAERNAAAPDPLLKRLAALALVRLGRFEEAIQESHDALRLGDMPSINQLVLAIAETKRGRMEVASSNLRQALAGRPSELMKPNDFSASAPSGVLWFESAEEWNALLKDAEAALATAPGKP
jgi:Flp pilus assembly protein TadD